MPAWLPPTAADQPSVTLTSWAAFEVQVPGLDAPTIHVAGYAEWEGSGRVTSPLKSVDAQRRSVVTSSGRVYRLQGGPGLSGDAEYVWRRWLRLWNATELSDATSALVEQFTAASSAGGEPPGER
ncbi:hypothetical protein ACPOLB_21880 [Rubrivivax sp. RP6-9]|uniref:hypothetical protein n=1 Tax=Rubrivivax sp. RP6-9 TaxID=3415750 RepID=UPI003CC6AFFA